MWIYELKFKNSLTYYFLTNSRDRKWRVVTWIASYNISCEIGNNFL